MLKASAVKTAKGYIPIIAGRHRVANGSYGIQKTQRLRGRYSERQAAVQAAQAHLDRVAERRASWANMVERSKAERLTGRGLLCR
jgi:hypothetical protein